MATSFYVVDFPNTIVTPIEPFEVVTAHPARPRVYLVFPFVFFWFFIQSYIPHNSGMTG